MLEELTTAEKMEFRPLVPEIGFRRPTPDDPRARKPKADEADYAEKLKAHNAFLMERDVYLELGYIRDDFSFLCTVITEAYGPNFSTLSGPRVEKEIQNCVCRGLSLVPSPGRPSPTSSPTNL